MTDIAAQSAAGERTLPCPVTGLSRRVHRAVPAPTCWPQLRTEWHPSRNGAATLDDFTPGSVRAVWWRCDAGHEWRAAIGARVQGAGCPYCAHRHASDDTCLEVVDAELAEQWHPTRNGIRTPRDVLPWSTARVWWRCAAGHEWRASVSTRSAARGCPYCSGHRPSETNNLAITDPDIAAQWHPSRNGTLTPRAVTAASGRRAWWRCDSGHEWRTPICVRQTSRGCPLCNRSRPSADHNLARTYPAVAAQWHPDLNAPLRPEQVAPTTSRRAWWLCPDGHVWKSSIAARTSRRTGCPICAQ
jgi:hypothetical protein